MQNHHNRKACSRFVQQRGLLRLFSILICIVTISQRGFAEIQVKDYLQRELVLSKPARRIVALSPHIVENLFAVGAGDYIVGAVDYSDYPKEAKSVPRVGVISAFSVEAIVALEPDVVFVWHSGRGARVLEKLQELGVPTYASDPRTLSDIPRSIRDYGKIIGRSRAAEAQAVAFEKRLAVLQDRYQNQTPVMTFYQIWDDPIQTLNGDHIVSDVISLCGGVNVFHDEPALAPRLGRESVIVANPEVIVSSGVNDKPPAWLHNWQRWPHLNAVVGNNLYNIPPDLIQRHTLRMLDGATLMCEYLQSARDKGVD